MKATIRGYEPYDEERVVALSLRAWEPCSERLRGCWDGSCSSGFEATGEPVRPRRSATCSPIPLSGCGLAEVGEEPIGFVAACLHRDSGVGEIYMIAVDPEAQGQGTGTALTEVATDWLRQSGMRVAMIETGGDMGHVSARRVYEKADYTALPAVRFFEAL